VSQIAIMHAETCDVHSWQLSDHLQDFQPSQRWGHRPSAGCPAPRAVP